MVDPGKKVPDLNCEVHDLLLEDVDLEQEVPDLRSGGIRLTGQCQTPRQKVSRISSNDTACMRVSRR